MESSSFHCGEGNPSAGDHLVRVGSFWYRNQADLLVARLAMEGIYSTLEAGEIVQVDWLLANALGGVKVYTLERDSEIAREMIESLGQPVTFLGNTKCTCCGEHLPDDWEACWKCADESPSKSPISTALDEGNLPSFQWLAVLSVVLLLVVYRAFGVEFLLGTLVVLGIMRWMWTDPSVAVEPLIDSEGLSEEPLTDDPHLAPVLDLNERAWRATVFSWFSILFSVPALLLLIATEEHASLLSGWIKWRRRLCWATMLFPLSIWAILLLQFYVSMAEGIEMLVYNGTVTWKALVGRSSF